MQTTGDEDLVPESLKPIGQFRDLYLLCEAKRENESYLVVIDQHAVHERILFENLKKQFAARQMTSQSLLFPKMLELTPEFAAILEKNSEMRAQSGPWSAPLLTAGRNSRTPAPRQEPEAGPPGPFSRFRANNVC